MKTMTEIGVMGGTFNPMHIRELAVAQFAQEQHGLAKVIFVPNGTPPHKKTDVLDRESRFEMVQAGVKDNPFSRLLVSKSTARASPGRSTPSSN